MDPIERSASRYSTKNITRISLLSIIAFLLMYVEFPLAFIAPPFIKIDLSDMPALIGGFAMGPIVGVTIEFIKCLLTLFVRGTTTGGIGELSNFIIGAVFVATSAIFYRRHKTYKGAVAGLLLGVFGMTAIATMSNYFVVFPLYAKIMPMDAIIQMGAAITSRVDSLWSLMVYCIVPFNLVKGCIVSIATLMIYKKVSHLLHR
ncbi:MAG: ECF transporter S component [Peptoniphilus sp.]|nr:ECF transporter S component [Peptoniphilus sp.]MDD7363605.1 ECF transporter S component [Bacillota bacterium]MDY6045204.1 ECF transporter S component [Peptoniphilus sp.]